MRSVACFIFCALLSSACGNGMGGGDDANGAPAGDLAGDLAAAVLCTTAACAASPCTANCFFSASLDGKSCPTGQSTVARGAVVSCEFFCGFLAGPGYGCLRYKSEVPICDQVCGLWGDAECLDWSPAGDYQTGGAICDGANGYFCDPGATGDMECIDNDGDMRMPFDAATAESDSATVESDSATPRPDLVSAALCTTPACATSPCTPNCAFTVSPDGSSCPNGQSLVSRHDAESCGAFCGFLQFPGYGCLRFKSEVAACNQECLPWSDPKCLDWSPAGDYQHGGAICDIANGYFCDPGATGDMSPPCNLDGGG